MDESSNMISEVNKKLEKYKNAYPLKRSWWWWYLSDERSKSWEERLKHLYTVKYVPEFWSLYESIKPPSRLNVTCDYMFFRYNIQPMWEVPENENGGRWLIQIDKFSPAIVIDTIWMEIILALIGEQFEDAMESICGIVCNVRGKGSKISLWTKDANDDETNLKIGNILRSKLLSPDIPSDCPSPLVDELRYEAHSSCQNKLGSHVKAKFTLLSSDYEENR